MKEKIYKLIAAIGMDRVAHFGIGVFITMICILSFSWFGIYPVVANSIVFSLMAAFIKEYIDTKKDPWDIIATMLGTGSMLGIFFFIKYLVI